MPQHFFQTIRARVRNPFLPVDISTRLPLHLTRILGIQCRYCSGIERIKPQIAAEIIPRIGWFTLAVNNRKRPLGVFDVRYERPWIDANDDYQELDVPIQGGSMITGTYNNELQYAYGATPIPSAGSSVPQGALVTGARLGGIVEWGAGDSGFGTPVAYDGLFFDTLKVSPGDIGIVNPATATNYDGYIVAIYLKCLGDTNLSRL